MSKVYIYALVDPRSGGVFYVGSTCNLKSRITAHLSGQSRQSSQGVVDVVRKLMKLNLRPRVRLMELTNEDNRAGRENYWVRHLKQKGEPLVNKRMAWQRYDGAIDRERVYGTNYLYTDQVERIDAMAETEYVTRAEMVRRLVDWALENRID
jgi:predicted GIY-YIG superfamily endonuclease